MTAKSLFEVAGKAVRLEAPRPLEASSRRPERVWSTERSLRDEPVQTALDLVVSGRIEAIQFAADSPREACSIWPHKVAISLTRSWA